MDRVEPVADVSGVPVPRFFYGTAWKEDATEALAYAAIGAGFRAIDTANQRRHYYEEGVGRALLQAVIAWAGEHGLIHIRLWAPSESAAALALYRHAGFQETGRRQSFKTDADRQIVELEYGERQ